MKKITREELEDIIKVEFGLNEITPLVGRQIGRFRLEHGYSYLEIARAVVYLAQQRKMKFDPIFGIGVVPSIMEESRQFFRREKERREARLRSLKETEGASNIILKPKMQKRKKISFTRETEE